jgi:hypothetical protein
MVKFRLLFIFTLFLIINSNGQNLKDFIWNPPMYKTGYFQKTGGRNEVSIYSNYTFKDSLAFDLPFDKKTLKLKNGTTLDIQLNSQSGTVYTNKQKVEYFENIYLSNYPDCKDCYVIRIRLDDKVELIYNPDLDDEPKSYKLFIKVGNKTIYGDGVNDLNVVFEKNPSQ